MTDFYEVTTKKTTADAEAIANTTLNELRDKYSSMVSAARMIEVAHLINEATKDFTEAERISGLVGALMFELL